MNRGSMNWMMREKVRGERSTSLPPMFVAGLLIVAFGAIARAGPPRHAAPHSPQTIAAAVQPFVDNHTLPGAVMLVATADRVLSLESVGYSDHATHQPMRADTLFWIASQSKPMTATALMMLVDEGKVSVDDPVEKYLPEFRNEWVKVEQDQEQMLLKRPVHPITIRNLLTHTSGLPFSSPLEVPTLDVLPLAVRVQSYAMMPLEFQPDSKYAYSNAGLNTVGRIIEVVSGIPYSEFMQQRLFQPLGMKDTTFWPTPQQVRRLAKSYQENADRTGLEETTITQLRYPLSDPTRQAVPAGGLFSTASDVARFCQMILNGGVLDGKRFLSQAAVKQMTSRQTPPALATSYGFGWTTDDGEFGHRGAYKTEMTIDRRHGLIFVWMVQQDGLPGDSTRSADAFMRAARAAFVK